MKLNKKDSAFGRHETFQLRYSWLPKGYQEFMKNNSVFESDESTVKLGVGKNMVSSIKHWLKATQLMNETLEMTQIAHYLLDEESGMDPYLEDEATIWLLHWLLCTNAKQSTTWFWFFNKFISSDFDIEEMQKALLTFIAEDLSVKEPARATLKNDCSVLTRMYSVSESTTKVSLDDVLDSPMSLLGLILKIDTKRFSSELSTRPELPLGIFGYAVADCINEYANDNERATMPTKDLIYSNGAYPSIAGVFRLTESDFMVKLEKLQASFSELFTIRETAGISQIYLTQGENQLEPVDFLTAHYKGELTA